MKKPFFDENDNIAYLVGRYIKFMSRTQYIVVSILKNGKSFAIITRVILKKINLVHIRLTSLYNHLLFREMERGSYEHDHD